LNDKEEFHHSRNQDLALTAIQKQAFPLFHYCGICDVSSVASVVHTNYGGLMGQGQNKGVDGAEVNSDMTATTFV
jgi:hypothetical protein